MSNITNIPRITDGTWQQNGTVTINPYPFTTIQELTGMQMSSSIAKISLALNKAQAKIGAATKGAANPYFKSKYADLASVMEACKEELNSQGISVLQPVVSDATGDYVLTVLLHESGEYLSSRVKLMVNKPNMQELGSAISYARRYGLQSMVFIPAEDDDGEKSMQRSAPAKTHTPAAKSTSGTTTVTSTTATVTTAVTPDLSLKATESLPAGAVQAEATVEPVKKSSFRKTKPEAAQPAQTTTESSSDWS